MAAIFEETKINNMTMRNRLIRSARWEGMCDHDGRPGDKLITIYCDLARGGIGLIITSYAYVKTDGNNLPGIWAI
jgi:2,4-dienoyl-CoA reductase-like NADH-dependent reductase (Old Yellow Enzyme family)